MNNYAYTYHSNQTTAPSEESLQKWGAWMESLGNKLVDGGNPITGKKAVLRMGEVLTSEPDSTIGYSIIKADSLNEAIELAAGNPLANAPGCEVRVYETGQM